MTQQEYAKAKRECWEEFRTHVVCGTDNPKGWFERAFDRAYALGKEKETISREDVENAAKKYAAEVDKNVHDLYGIENLPVSLTFGECAAESFREGANFALGKQEKDADTVIQGWVGRDEDGFVSIYQDKPTRDEYDCRGFWHDDNSESHIELPIGSFPSVTWQSEPKRVRITIETIDE